MQSNIKFLLDYCQDIPEVYNWVANKLYVEFGINQAELFLLCSFIADQYLEYIEREKVKNEYRKGNKGKNNEIGGIEKSAETHSRGYV